MTADVSIEVHSKADCPHCAAVKEWLAEQGIPFTERRHDDNAERQAFYDGLGLVGDDRRVPQVILVDGPDRHRLGGNQATRVSGVESLFRPPPTPGRPVP